MTTLLHQKSLRPTRKSTQDSDLGIGMEGLRVDEDQGTRRVLGPRN